MKLVELTEKELDTLRKESRDRGGNVKDPSDCAAYWFWLTIGFRISKTMNSPKIPIDKKLCCQSDDTSTPYGYICDSDCPDCD